MVSEFASVRHVSVFIIYSCAMTSDLMLSDRCCAFAFMLTLVTSALFLARFAKKWTQNATAFLIAIILLVAMGPSFGQVD